MREHFRDHGPEPTASPSHALEELEALEDQEASSGKLVQVISTDAALVARLLKAANSAYYGRPEPVDTLRGALTLIGNKGVRQVVVAVCGQSLFDFGASEGFRRIHRRLEAEHHHALTCSFAAAWLALQLDSPQRPPGSRGPGRGAP